MLPRQTEFDLGVSYDPVPQVPLSLHSEIARAWRLPLRECVEIRLRDNSIPALRGPLELLTAPDYPWDPRQPLSLRIAGYTFHSHEIESWTQLPAHSSKLIAPSS